ncbi:hypothetical protein VC35_05505 [Pseudomonas fluorescens]|uniref:Uncharacterized protein n=1 Tax=Pseudomonas fluorescens TaxID=294 RepID=A0A0F4TYP8_PSEFL|nr:hypothetical protein VC35_05505 [Pseudomonas fluorescens]
MTAAGTLVETIGAETTGIEITGAENKPAEKQNAIVIGNAIRIGPCGTDTRTIAATIVASAMPSSLKTSTRYERPACALLVGVEGNMQTPSPSKCR